MINEIFISRWDPVVPIPCMSPAQLDNELERIHTNLCKGQSIAGPKIDPDREFDRGFDAGVKSDMYAVLPENEKFWLQGYEKGYTAGRDAAEKRFYGPAL